MGAQTQIAASQVLTWAVQPGEWHNAAARTPGEFKLTDDRGPDWDRCATEPHTTQIDYVLCNAAGLQVLLRFRLVHNLPCPGHLGVEITLRLPASKTAAPRWKRLVPCPVDEVDMPIEERGALGVSL